MGDRRNEATQLGLIGLVPYLLAFIGVWLSPWIVSSTVAYDLRETALIYGAMNASYHAGFAGGGILAKSDRTNESLVPGGVAALVAWVAAWPVGAFGLSPPEFLRYVLVIGVLAYFLLRDLRAVAEGLLPAWYGPLRMRLTFWASISLAMIAARLIISDLAAPGI
jgi:hypothetical protein